MKYKSRGLRRRGNDSWQARITHTDPLTGEPVTTYHTIKASSERQAKEKRDELILSLETGGLAMGVDVTVEQFMKSFLDYKEQSKTVESSTMRGYKGETRLMCRYIGAELISDLNVPTINAWMAKMSADDYAPKTIAKCFRLLKQALNYAISLDLLMKNPCNFCKPPKRVKTPINALCREDRSRMLDLARQAQPNALAVAIEIALTTGMRRAEVCALRWDDFDQDKGAITVSHAFGNGEGGFYLKEPKNGRTRTIPLTAHTRRLLEGMLEDSRWMLGKLKVPFSNCFILGTQESESRPYNPTQLGKDFAAFCKMNKFSCTFHDLRHTFATYLIAQGVDIITVANYLGHSSPSMTLDIYADVDPDAKARAVGKIEDAFDDAMSVFERTAAERRKELEQQSDAAETSDAGKAAKMSANAIPFSIEELEEMLAVLRRAS